MTAGLLLVAASMATFGLAVVASALRPAFGAGSLRSRLAPHVPGVGATPDRTVDAIALAAELGTRLSAVIGTGRDFERRLRLAGETDAATFRARQVAWTGVASIVGAALATAVVGSGPFLVLAPAGLGGLTFLGIDAHLRDRAERRRRTVELELPVVADQLATLLSAGWSLGAAIGRLGLRGRGAVAEDLRTVHARVGQGVPEAAALTEWADLVGSASVDRLVAVLTLDRSTSDLGGLVTREAKAIRDEHHRRLLAAIERQAQQIWIPVTVATLVPGVVFLMVPFLSAVRTFTS